MRNNLRPKLEMALRWPFFLPVNPFIPDQTLDPGIFRYNLISQLTETNTSRNSAACVRLLHGFGQRAGKSSHNLNFFKNELNHKANLAEN